MGALVWGGTLAILKRAARRPHPAVSRAQSLTSPAPTERAPSDGCRPGRNQKCDYYYRQGRRDRGSGGVALTVTDLVYEPGKASIALFSAFASDSGPAPRIYSVHEELAGRVRRAGRSRSPVMRFTFGRDMCVPRSADSGTCCASRGASIGLRWPAGRSVYMSKFVELRRPCPDELAGQRLARNSRFPDAPGRHR